MATQTLTQMARTSPTLDSVKEESFENELSFESRVLRKVKKSPYCHSVVSDVNNLDDLSLEQRESDLRKMNNSFDTPLDTDMDFDLIPDTDIPIKKKYIFLNTNGVTRYRSWTLLS